MNYLMAKVKGRGIKKLKKLISDVELYDGFDPSECLTTDYAADHNLDGDCWFKISNFSEKEYCFDWLKSDFVIGEYNQLEARAISDIRYMFYVKDEMYFFQKVTPSQIMNKAFLSYKTNFEIEEGVTRIVINERPDAVYIKGDDALIFRNLTTISSIFKGVEELYREATEEETQEFLSQDFIELKNEYEASKVGKLNRQRIALAMETLRLLGDEQKGQLFLYIKGYCDNLNFNEEVQTFEVCDEESLKNLVYGIEQRFYSTIIGAEKRLANSIVRLG